MRGRIPKDPNLRHRPHKVSTAAEMSVDSGEKVVRPPLTAAHIGADRVAAPVHRWWRVIWASPMASRWLPTDVEGLYVIAALRNAFAANASAGLAAEIRHQEGRYGLDVMSRRRLDWNIVPATAEPERPTEAPDSDQEDPRKLLRPVK